MESQKCLEFTVRILKVLAYTLTFIVVLASGVIAKGTVLFMTSQLKKDKRLAYCNRNLGKSIFYLTWYMYLLWLAILRNDVIKKILCDFR